MTVIYVNPKDGQREESETPKLKKKHIMADKKSGALPHFGMME